MPPPESDFPVFPPVASHHSRMYSLSPEAVVAGSPTSPTPLQSSLSPVAMVPQPEQLSLPPLPPESQSDSEQPADDPSGSSSSKAVLPRTSAKRKRRHNLSEELQNDPSSGSPRAYMGKIPLPKPTSTPVPKAPKSRLASQSEKKSLSLACFFCRGRKIACGPQDPNSADRTCNQCHRRSLKCEYPTESRRGMRKNKSGTMNQGFRAEKGFVEAAAPKVAARASTSTSDPKV
ncbi:hypothetical protein BT96DRAFT_28458 [Gymnopus androsaceus JB14]|uniref:Zn(2)-C6 fungal-type domain-containing protein n=1 Tax=Gymnopus androsaceus JB14 TaxID=1447944 RepID=A0A6A4IC82_9AGAR|nr:hypothetical protein BT96DRAFT_28458 [Gymnopus androsaceus JB14]